MQYEISILDCSSTLQPTTMSIAKHFQSPPQPSLSPRASLLALPTELQLHILSYLDYPSVLALRHCHPRFYPLINTNANIKLKVAWLIHLAENAELYGLDPECPFKFGISLKSDAEFCRSVEVRRILRGWFKGQGKDGLGRSKRSSETRDGRWLEWDRAGAVRRRWWGSWGGFAMAIAVLVLAVVVMAFRNMALALWGGVVVWCLQQQSRALA